ncbi:MAG TPA: hypothetical protein VFC80_01925 [Sphaerochaeta sp.]|nr:hypothetical protein [Sphaerochaeta sp.]
MVGFFIKKAFFDGWDNLIGLVVQNLGFLVIFFLGLGSLTLLGEHGMLAFGGLLVTGALLAFFAAGSSYLTWEYAHYRRGGWNGFVQGIRISWRHALLYWFLITLALTLIIFVIPFYLSYSNFLGIVLSILLFWLFLAIVLALPYYWPLFYSMQGDGPTKTLKKTFIILIDNLFFSIFLLIHQGITAAISIFLAGLAPGAAGLLMGQSVAVKILMFKYDWLEENPDADRKAVPWDELLYEERESVGHRTLRNMIFPWKD